MKGSQEVSPARLREAFLRRARVPESQFERELFLRCVPPLQRPAARLLLWLDAGLFRRDLETIRTVSVAASADEVRDTAGELGGGMLYRRTWVRDTLGIRASGRRLVAIAKQVME
ncbi:MAG: hypothetical protein KF791_07575 [Verrucomicrobiae bacterium]|nr:hypothetical protein [Verrucomicrobiae bacterium]